jgi:hypothetical protein
MKGQHQNHESDCATARNSAWVIGIVPRFVGKTPLGEKAFIALGLTAGNKTAAIRRRRTRAVVLYSTVEG